MASDIALTPGMRANLQSLENTNDLLGRTSERLSSGRKVDSALDDPGAFFTARNLSNRAEDMSGLLDGMGQAIQTLKAADSGLEGLHSLVEQAQAVATEAKTAVQSGSSGGGATGVTVTPQTGGTSFMGALTAVGLATGTDSFRATTDAAATQKIAGYGAMAPPATTLFQRTGSETTLYSEASGTMIFTVGGGTDQLVRVTEGMTMEGFLEEVNRVEGMTASITDNGGLQIKASDTLEIRDDFTGSTNFARALGIAEVHSASTITMKRLDISGASGAAWASLNHALFANSTTDASNTTKHHGNKITFKTGSNTQKISIGYNHATNRYSIKNNDNGSTNVVYFSASPDAAEVVSTIERSFMTALGNMDTVSHSTDTDGTITIKTDGSKRLSISGGGGIDNTLSANLGVAGYITTEGSTTVDTIDHVNQYNDLRTQIDQMIRDTGYQGINLLNGSNLAVDFNEEGSSRLDIEGVTFDSQGLGLGGISGAWDSETTVQDAIDQTKSALTVIESRQAEFGRNMSVVQTRQDFTESLANTLVTGSEKLALADIEEEGANMTALQTRQQLATTSLSLSAQSSRSVLSLF